MALVFSAALEELLPHLSGVGFPLLLGLVIFTAREWTVSSWVLIAITAGAMEDALSSLPFALAVSFFLLIAFAVHKFRSVLPGIIFGYPLFQFWVASWLPFPNGGFFNRMLISIPVGVLTLGLMALLLGKLQRKAGIDA